MVSRSVYRPLFVVLLLCCAGVVGYAYATAETKPKMDQYRQQASVPFDQREPVVPPRENVTVVTGHGMNGDAAAVVAFAPDGRVLYYNDTHAGYEDVDPVPNTSATVEYVAEKPLTGERSDACDAKCTVSLVERVNLSTGDVTRVHSRTIPQDRGANWHDVDRIDEHRLLVGDIHRDAVFVVNTTTDVTTWRWSVADDYPITEGGPYPTDWAHLNDVERLPDGRYMASLRNQDQVVFLNESGLIEGWTLGSENDYDVLYEQHNPDYIPESRGGPAVVVADSLNDRVVEYQRRNGSWEQTWVWNDSEMSWPRDADRLPNGNTLVSDSNSNRVLEVNESGSVAWSIPFYSVYEAERLGTGDESAGGPSAVRANLASRTTPGEPRGVYETVAHALLPRKTVNGVTFVLPMWAGLGELLAVAVAALAVLAWAGLELRDSSLTVDLEWPVTFRR
ncbi:hypothetical protein DMJ13_08885 [halophilic archaeon]|nr:hypothetical protein DMJ13_08885 [halophilic archaeon]